MDQIAVMGLKALQAYKQQLDDAQQAVTVARVLYSKIELFEVTIGMIPQRGNKDDVSKIKKLAGADDDADGGEDEKKGGEKSLKDKAKKVAKDAAGYAVDQAESFIMDQVQGMIANTPLGVVTGLLGSVTGGDKTPITRAVKPADILAAMRVNGSSDLEVSFVAMGFIIQSAIKIVKEALGDVKEIQIPQWYWLCMPWKVSKQNEVGERLQGHFDALDKFNVQLQSAVSIASYCVSLEQLENVLNATNVLVSLRIREFWKKKVGISNTRVKMSELAESYMSEVENQMTEYKKEQRHFPERILKNHGSSEVAFNRFLSYLWNGNGDEIATVYEVNSATEKYAFKFGAKADTILLTFQKIVEIQNDFFSKIEIVPLKANAGKDGKEGTDDDQLVYNDAAQVPGDILSGVELNPSDKVVVLKPFQRLRVVCTVPQFDPDIFEYDFISLLKYDKVNTVKQLVKSSNDLALEEVPGSRTYLVSETNQEFYGDDQSKWNAPKAFKDKNGKDQKILGFKKSGGKVNFETNKIAAAVVDDDAIVKKADDITAPGTLDTGGISNTTTVLYTPLVSDPGLYTVRYCLNDLVLDEHDTPGSLHKKKLALAPKAYYYNRLITQPTLDEKFKSKIITSDLGFGDNNFKLYSMIAIKSLDLENSIAKTARDLPALRRIYREKSKLLNNFSNDKEVEAASIKLVTPTLPFTTVVSTTTVGGSSPSPSPSSRTLDASGEDSVKMIGNPLSKLNRTVKVEEKAYDVTPLINLIDSLSKKILYPPKSVSAKPGDVPKDTTKIRNYLLELQKKVRQSATNYNDLLNSELAVNRLVLAVELTTVIERVNAYLDSNLKNWIASINGDAIQPKKLEEADKSIRLLKLLEGFRKTLVPSELSSEFGDSSTTETTATAKNTTSSLSSDKKSAALKEEKEKMFSYLIDPESDRTEEAKDNLADRLFLQYYNCKKAILELDAIESSSQKHIRRLEILQEIIVKLEKARDEKVTSLNAAAISGPDGKSKRSSVCNGENFKGISRETAVEILQLGKEKKATTRSTAIQQIDALIKDINDYIDALLETSTDPKKEAFYNDNLDTIKQLVKVIEELEYYREEAKYLPQYGYPTTEEEIKLAKILVHPPYGLIVLVEDANALAWGERVDEEDDYDYGEVKNKESSPTKWRPMIEYRYPYNSKQTIKLKKENFDFDTELADAEEDKKNLTYAVYYNATTKKKDKKGGDATAASAAAAPPAAGTANAAATADGESDEKVSPTHFGIFANDKLLGEAYALDKNSNYRDIDFYTLIHDDKNGLKDQAEIRLTVQFLQPVNEGTPSEILAGGPILTVIISDDLDEYDVDGDDGAEDEYYDDDDDDEDENDDSEEYDEEYEEFMINTKFEQADLCAKLLPEEAQVEDHEAPLKKMEEVYAGEYVCNICSKTGRGWVYHCDDDNYDAHPQCAIWDFNDYYNQALEENGGEEGEGEEEGEEKDEEEGEEKDEEEGEEKEEQGSDEGEDD